MFKNLRTERDHLHLIALMPQRTHKQTSRQKQILPQRHRNKHIYIYVYMYIYVCVCGGVI